MTQVHDGDIFVDLFRRDGHATDLSLERLTYDDVDPRERAALEAHLSACARCADRLSAFADVPAEPLPQPSRAADAGDETPLAQVIPLRRRRNVVLLGTVLAAAAAVALVLRPGAPTPQPAADEAPDTIRLRGGALSMRVVLDDGGAGRVLADGDAVRGGDRVGFSVRAREAGWLMVVGLDDTGKEYLCFPQEDGGHARRVDPSDRFARLEDAVRFDALPGSERLVAVLCPAPFDLALAARFIRGEVAADALPGCSLSRLALRKQAGP